jgi:arylformamidase
MSPTLLVFAQGLNPNVSVSASMDGYEIIDISPEIHSGIGVFPGDTPFKEEFLLSFENGDHLGLSKIETTVHLGAHADAPSHYSPSGESIEQLALERYFGWAQIIPVPGCRGRRILVDDIRHLPIEAPRVLFKTGSFPNPNQWNSDFASLSAELVEYLHEKGVELVGIDTPSIDPEQDKVLESHKTVARHGMSILEGIVLENVRPGVYCLVAFPLRIRGADASPLRAVLLKEVQ